MDDKLNIEKIETIDGIAFQEETSKLIMLLADGMDWTDENNHMLLLQSKLNNYIKYIDTEQYIEKYPNTKNIEIQIKFLFKEPEICYQFIDRVKEITNNLFDNVNIIVEHGEKD